MNPSLGPGPWGVYVHLPWCRRQCPYCSFFVITKHEDQGANYVSSLLDEYRHRRPEFDEVGPAISLFFGGGTPSRLAPEHLSRLIAGIAQPSMHEVTLEANPEDIDQASLDHWLHLGINRLSLGIQTFHPVHSKTLSRAYPGVDPLHIARTVSGAGFQSWSVDLIFGVPGQSMDDLERDLDHLAVLSPPHVALYGLTIEPGTPFERARDRGSLSEVAAEEWQRMYYRIVQRLRQDLDLHQYEVSNFAKPGHESAHNQLYWTDRPYLGLGPSAHGYLPSGDRYENPRTFDAYLAGAPDSLGTPSQLSPEQSAMDLLISALRSRQGVDRPRLRARTGLSMPSSALDPLANSGLLTFDAHAVRLTPAGFAVADGITERLIRHLVPADNTA